MPTSMIVDELRRQAEVFSDLVELKCKSSAAIHRAVRHREFRAKI
jgi:hypothetical protein